MSKNASNIHKILRMSDFKLKFTFRTIKLSNIITPYLKPGQAFLQFKFNIQVLLRPYLNL